MRRLVICSILLAVLVQATAGAIQKSDTYTSTDPQQQLTITRNLTSMPLAFTENQGQWDEQVKFRADAGGATMWFTTTGAYYQFTRRISEADEDVTRSDNDVTLSPRCPELAEGSKGDVREEKAGLRPFDELRAGVAQPDFGDDRFSHELDSIEQMVIWAKFVGANPNPQVIGDEMMEYKCNYFIGNDPDKWHTDVPNYRAIVLEDVYAGIDLKYYGNGKQMEYDFIVSPGADFTQIQIEYEGAKSLSINETGELVVETDWGIVTELRPLVYQTIDGKRTPIAGEYTLLADHSFGFRLPDSYNPALTLVIDPVLRYSTYVGGSNIDYGYGITVDGSGCAYITGHTYSSDFPTTDGAYQTDQGAWDAFVTKLNSSGNSLVYSTYLGGGSGDYGFGIAVDGSGNAYITGYTVSTNFPTLNPYQTDPGDGVSDVFVTKLSSSGNSLVYSTYLGGSAFDDGSGIAVDGSGNAYITGRTTSLDFPTKGVYQATFNGGTADAFVTKLNSTGNGLVYSTYLGGSKFDKGLDIAVDGSGNAYVTGGTGSSNFPTKGAFQTDLDGMDAFVTKLNSIGNNAVYSTYLGGSSGDYGYGISVDGSGNAYITGYTNSSDFATEGAYQADYGGGPLDAFVTKLNSSGNDLVYSTYLGGDNSERGWDISVDGSGNAYITGHTNSSDFATEGAYQADFGGGVYDAFVTKLNSTGNSLIYSTYLGGSGDDESWRISVDGSGNAYVTGRTESSDFPTEGEYQTAQGNYDAFVTKLSAFNDIDGDGYTANVDCDDSDPYTYPGAATSDDPSACMRDTDEDDYGDMYATGDIVPGTDCDDAVASIYPGAPEVPDDEIDQDCNGADAITCFLDADMDGYGTDVGTTVIAPDGSCDKADGESDNMNDCDDSQPTIYPGATEIPDDDVDQDCNGVDAITCIVDADQDGYGNDQDITVIALDGSCDTGDMESYNMDDCDDAMASINPGATEIPDDEIDQDCNGFDEITCFVDSDLDGYGTDLGTILLAPDGSCDAVQGESDNMTDCNDGVASINPGATEIPNDDVDQDCNGVDAITCIVDADQDGYGNDQDITVIALDGSCDTGDMESYNMDDCDDAMASINPGATEVPDDAIDQDCNGFDEITCFVDSDLDGYGTDLGTILLAPDGSCDAVQGESDNMEDCDDSEDGINPGATEIPGDGIDQDCDGEDPCCVGRVGDANGLGGDEPTIGDVSVMIDAKFITGTCVGILDCLQEADINQSGGNNATCDDITIGDISTLIDYLFITGKQLGLPACK